MSIIRMVNYDDTYAKDSEEITEKKVSSVTPGLGARYLSFFL